MTLVLWFWIFGKRRSSAGWRSQSSSVSSVCILTFVLSVVFFPFLERSAPQPHQTFGADGRYTSWPIRSLLGKEVLASQLPWHYSLVWVSSRQRPFFTPKC